MKFECKTRHWVPAGAGCYSAQEMARQAWAHSEENHSPIVFLPLDCVAEAEGYGLPVKGYEDGLGLRRAAPLCTTAAELLAIPPLSYSKGRLREILGAISLLNGLGKTICLNVSGSFTIVDMLLPAGVAFGAWKRNRNIMEQVLERVNNDLSDYVLHGAKVGAKLISISDPTVSPLWVGDKMAGEVSQHSIFPLVQNLCEKIDGGVHVCGVISTLPQVEKKLGLQCTTLSEVLPYQQAVAESIKSGRGCTVFGHACINSNCSCKQLWKRDCRN